MPDPTLANLFASKFIARPDAKAIQFSNGAWAPHCEWNPETRKHDGPRIGWRRQDLQDHLDRKSTFGHYMLSGDSECKLFAFDVDLKKAGSLPQGPYFAEDEPPDWSEKEDLRAAWLNRAHPARDYMKLQFKQMAHMLLKSISEELALPCAAAYSGGKGIHVYAFTGKISAAESRLGAQIVLDSIGGFKADRGDNFFIHEEYTNFSIELFPKQDSLEGKDLGNLMRLPLGRNLKAPKEPCFFIDMLSPIGVLQPMDPVTALTIETPWTPF